MRLLLLLLGVWIASVAFAIADEAKPPVYVIPERVLAGSLVCAQYTSTAAPRQPNRTCWEMALIRELILKNARPADECH